MNSLPSDGLLIAMKPYSILSSISPEEYTDMLSPSGDVSRTYILEINGSNLRREVGYADRDIFWFSVSLKLSHFLPNPFQFIIQ
jgi:hypothetical protein